MEGWHKRGWQEERQEGGGGTKKEKEQEGKGREKGMVQKRIEGRPEVGNGTTMVYLGI